MNPVRRVAANMPANQKERRKVFQPSRGLVCGRFASTPLAWLAIVCLRLPAIWGCLPSWCGT